MPDAFEEIFSGSLTFNGVNAVTGDYGVPPLTSERLARLIRGHPSPEDYREFVARQKRLGTMASLQERLEKLTEPQLELEQATDQITLEMLRDKIRRQSGMVASPLKEGAGDPARVSDAGWAVVFPAMMNPNLRDGIKEALKPLLDLRSAQAGELFHIYDGGAAYRAGERIDQFFKRQQPEIRFGPADPTQMPFYVLLIGTPDEIPYAFQYQLDVMRGVGRLDFGSDLEAYARYAASVVAAESGRIRLPRRAALFGTMNPGDEATQLSARYLVEPIFENLQAPELEHELALKHEWDVLPPFIGANQATKAQLKRLLGGDQALTPALLLTATHGVEFPIHHPDQMRYQGALLCQDWEGPGSRLLRDHYLAAEDIEERANMLGMMALLFACYGAGTPELDQFAKQAFRVREKIAPHSFTAALPQRMLRQGALAVVGHVERAWGYSFISPGGNLDNDAFVVAVRSLMNGEPVGLATDMTFNLRYADMSSTLSATLEELEWAPEYISEYELAHLWTANNDARSYVVLGDPAARIPAANPNEVVLARPELGTIRLSAERSLSAAPLYSGTALPQLPTNPAPRVQPAVAYGLQEQVESLRASLKRFTEHLAASLRNAADDVATLDVRTHITDDLAAVAQALDTRQEISAKLRALTRISLNGDVDVYVPGKADGGIDKTLWDIHKAMVDEAQTNRAQFLQTIAELVTRLLDSLTGL